MTSKKPNSVLRPVSTAEATAHCLVEAGVPKSQINGEYLVDFYSRLSESADTAIGMQGPGFELSQPNSIDQAPVMGVIIETRPHPALEFVVNQFAKNLSITIQLYHGRENEHFIKSSSIGNRIRSGQVHLTNMGINKLTRQQYNAMLLTENFWTSVKGRNKILVFQTDALLCARSSYYLDDFMNYDYIGSKWKRQRPVGIKIDGGNGGLSLRDWGLSVDCIRRFPVHLWPGGEDGFFAFHMDLIGANVARELDCARFSTQIEFTEASFGAHKIRDLSPESLQKFLEYCPDARLTL